MARGLLSGVAFVTIFAACTLSGASAVVQTGSVNTLTPQEKASGWKLLFDGTTVAGWRGFKNEAAPAGWKAIEGELVRVSNSGDLMTIDQYSDFELRYDWKIGAGGNSGVMFRVTTEGGQTWHSGPEVQVLDNAGHKDGANPITSAASNYAVHPPNRDVTRPLGEWNEARLVVKGAHVEHWLNGVKVVEYELWSDDWNARVQASKFGKIPLYAKAKRGHIAIQDHGDMVWYRSIKIREL